MNSIIICTFLLLPYLRFLDDAYDMYMSSFVHALNYYYPRPRLLHKPLSQAMRRGTLPTKTSDRLGRMSVMKGTIRKCLFEIPPVGELIEHLNLSMRMIAASKGLLQTNIPTIASKLPLRDPVSPVGWTILDLLEASARWQESSFLSKYAITDSARGDWSRAKIFGVYKVIFEPLMASMDWDLVAIMLRLATRGRFFPFVSEGILYLEDFHPVALLHRMLEFFFNDQKLHLKRPRWTTNALLSYYTDILMRLRSEFDLARSPGEFLDNEEALEARFPKAFPEAWESQGFQAYLLERKTLHERRSAAFGKEA